ncbi:MAG: T9SS type A sorting domain-containing protein, partial [Chitinophagaceae bacterium]
AEWRTSWSGAGPVTDTAIAGNDIKKYTAVDFVGIQLTNPIDVTLADSVHISVWTPSASAFGIKIVNTGGGPANENLVWFDGNPGTFNRPKPAQGQWNDYSLPLSLFATANGANILTVRNAIHQILFVGTAPFNNNTYYIDNFYFSSSTNVLPVDFKAFTATKANNSVQLVWEVANEVNVSGYSVERSVNGTNFAAIGFVNASSKNSYSFTDANAVSGTNYYRIKSVDKDGSVKYSSTKSVNNNGNKAEYAIYPNPASNELVLKNLVGSNSVSIIDVAGKVVLNRVNVTNNNATINITSISKGLYTVVINNGKENNTFKLVIEK